MIDQINFHEFFSKIELKFRKKALNKRNLTNIHKISTSIFAQKKGDIRKFFFIKFDIVRLTGFLLITLTTMHG